MDTSERLAEAAERLRLKPDKFRVDRETSTQTKPGSNLVAGERIVRVIAINCHGTPISPEMNAVKHLDGTYDLLGESWEHNHRVSPDSIREL